MPRIAVFHAKRYEELYVTLVIICKLYVTLCFKNGAIFETLRHSVAMSTKKMLGYRMK